MMMKSVTELKSVFPADLQSLDNAEILKQSNRTIDTGSVDLVSAGGHQLMHSLWFASLQSLKNHLPWTRQTLVLPFQTHFQLV